MVTSPATPAPGIAHTASEQELRQAVAGPHQIAAHILDRTGQVTELLIGKARHEREPQLPGRQQPRQPDRVTPIGLDPITRPPRDRPRRDNLEPNPTLTSGPGQPEPGRTRLIHRARSRTEPLQE